MLCKICNNGKTANAAHVKTHGLTYAEYVEKYEPEKHLEKELMQKLSSLYIRRRDNYIKFNRVTSHWMTLTYSKTKKIVPLTDESVLEHLRHKECYGIKTDSSTTHLLVFDIDFENPLDSLQALKKVTGHLKKLGINESQMLCSWSGRRGYHIAVFFEQQINKGIVKGFYERVIQETGYKPNEVEGKGINGHGVKLPLGINFKNTGEELSNFCYLTDLEGTRIKDSLARLNEVQLVSVALINAISSNTPTADEHFQKVQEASYVLEEIVKEVAGDEYYNLDEERLSTVFEHKLKYGIEALGTRHNTSFFLAVYMKDTKKMAKGDILESLYNWTKDVCPKKYYKTPLHEVREELVRMLDSVFRNNYKLKQVKRHITLTELDQLNIVYDNEGTMMNKTDIKTMFIFTRHSKVYADDEGIFYMTYKQFAELNKNDPNKQTIANRASLKKRFEKLQSMGKLEIVASNVYRPGAIEKQPNKYRVLGIDNTYRIKVHKKIKDIEVCSCSSINMDKLIDVIKANVTGKAGRKPKICTCKA